MIGIYMIGAHRCRQSLRDRNLDRGLISGHGPETFQTKETTMRKWQVGLVCGVSLILLWWKSAPGSQAQLFDSKKTQQELEIMKGILRTTLDFASKELQG